MDEPKPAKRNDTVTALGYAFLFIGLIGCTVGTINQLKTSTKQLSIR